MVAPRRSTVEEVVARGMKAGADAESCGLLKIEPRGATTAPALGFVIETAGA